MPRENLFTVFSCASKDSSVILFIRNASNGMCIRTFMCLSVCFVCALPTCNVHIGDLFTPWLCTLVANWLCPCQRIGLFGEWRTESACVCVCVCVCVSSCIW